MYKDKSNLINVTIDKHNFANLLISEYKLSLLEADGVDNWDGYDASLEDSLFEQVLESPDSSEVIDLLFKGEYKRH